MEAIVTSVVIVCTLKLSLSLFVLEDQSVERNGLVRFQWPEEWVGHKDGVGIDCRVGPPGRQLVAGQAPVDEGSDASGGDPPVGHGRLGQRGCAHLGVRAEVVQRRAANDQVVELRVGAQVFLAVPWMGGREGDGRGLRVSTAVAVAVAVRWEETWDAAMGGGGGSPRHSSCPS